MASSGDEFVLIQQQLASGCLPDAEGACRKFLQDHPRHAEALDLLGRIQCQQGQYDEAIRSIKQAIALRPDAATLHHHLGYVYFAAGNVDRSIEQYRRGLTLDETDAEALNDLGVALKAKGQLEEAASAFQSARRLRPDLAFPHRNLADVLRLQGKLDLAITHYQQALRLAPGDAEAHNGLGQVFSIQAKRDKAIEQFEEAIKLKADYEEAENNLGTVLCAAERFDDAVALYENALRRQPDFVTARVNLGSVLIELGRFDEAVEHLEHALRIDPNHAIAYHNLGDLALTNKYEFAVDQLDRIKSLVANNKGRREDTSALHFTLAGILDKQLRYDEAFRAYQQANNSRYRASKAAGVSFDPEQHRRQLEETSSVFGQDLFRNMPGGGIDAETPVFVVGMPRSGTTLVEQIISSHPRAVGAGELTGIEHVAPLLPEFLKSEQEYPHCMRHANPQTIRGIAQNYLNLLTGRWGDADRIVDKAWYNFFYLGLICTLFPKARVIHCRRDAMDVCISCFFCNFNSIPWAWRLEDIGAFYRSYQRLMDHWHEVLPLRIHEVSYEQLVADHEKVSREMIEYCGLDWSDRCLEFYKNRRPVQTASRVQVRQPIYNTSIGRWRKYESHLSPLREALDGMANAEDTTPDDRTSS